MEKQYLSQEKYDELSQELEHLKTDRRKDVAEKLEFAKSLGDLSENAEYQEAREEQASVEERIMTLEAILKSAEIVSHTTGSIVTIGSDVVVKKKGSKEERKFTIVGSEEVDMEKGKISNKSPLGIALLGNKKGEDVVCHAPNGDITYTIVDVK